MKKFLLIALISGSAFAANAQQSYGRHGENDRNHQSQQMERGYDQRENRQHEMDSKIAAINSDYNNRINDIQYKPFMRAKQRRREIKQLERERSVALQQCRDNYSRDYGSANHSHRF